MKLNAAQDAELMSNLDSLHELDSSGRSKDKFSQGLNNSRKIDINRLKQKASQFRKLNESSATPAGTENSDRDSINFSNHPNVCSDETGRTPDKRDLKHGITISDSDFYFDQTIPDKNFNNLNFNTNDEESKGGRDEHQQTSGAMKKEDSVPLSALEGSEIFNLSEDSTMKKSNVFLSSFVTTLDNKGNSTMKSSALADSMAYSDTKLSFNKEQSKVVPMEVIQSESGDSESQVSPEHTKKPDPSDDDDEDFDRFEEIDVKAISIGNKTASTKKNNQKALLSPLEIKEAKQERGATHIVDDYSPAQYVLQCKNLIESGKFVAADFKGGSTSLYESMEILNNTSKLEFNSYIESQLLQFHPNYEFGPNESANKEICKHSLELVADFEEQKPTVEEIYYYVKYVMLSSRMENEIPIMALVYIERLLTKIGALMNHWNWRRLVLISLILSSKIWDDESLENVHFPQAMPDLTLKEVNSLEKIFLELVAYELNIKGSDYAKYYFVLRSLPDKQENDDYMEIEPISYDDMKKLQKNSCRAEGIFRGDF